MSAISSIQLEAVRTAIERISSKLLNGRPPPIVTAELTLLRKTRSILAKPLSGHCGILGQCTKRLEQTARNYCLDYGHSPSGTHHFFHCPSKPPALTVELLLMALLINRQGVVFRGFGRRRPSQFKSHCGQLRCRRMSVEHCRHRPIRHQKGNLMSRESSEVLAAVSVGR